MLTADQPLVAILAQFQTAIHKAAPDGAVHVITRHRSQADGPGGWRNSNLRTRFEKIIDRAGLEPWLKLFHGLRASLETELVESFPVQVVAAWLGNAPLAQGRAETLSARTARTF